MSASLNWIAWCFEIGTPKVRLSLAYASDAPRHACATPTDKAPIAIRPLIKVLSNGLYPPPRPPRRFSWGPSHVSKLGGGGLNESKPTYGSDPGPRRPGSPVR